MVGDQYQFEPAAERYVDRCALSISDKPNADEQVRGASGSPNVGQALFQFLRDFRTMHRERSASRCAHRTQLLIFEREFQFACREPGGSIAAILVSM